MREGGKEGEREGGGRERFVCRKGTRGWPPERVCVQTWDIAFKHQELKACTQCRCRRQGVHGRGYYASITQMILSSPAL